MAKEILTNIMDENSINAIFAAVVAGIILFIFRKYIWNIVIKVFKLIKKTLKSINKHFKLLKLNKEFKAIVESVQDIFSSDKTCGLLALIINIQEDVTIDRNKMASIVCAHNILDNWYRAYKYTVLNKDNVSCLYSYDEFGFILMHIQKLTEDIVKLISKDKAEQLKKDPRGYPLFKKIFNEVSSDFKELSRNSIVSSISRFRASDLTVSDL